MVLIKDGVSNLNHRPSKKEMEDALHAAGLRVTRQRRAIVEYLASTDRHPTARQLYGRVQGREPGLSLATVYNTLGTLVKMGLLKLIEFDSLENRYDTNTALHINLICTGCGEIMDWEDSAPASQRSIREQTGFEVMDHRMEYYGLCRACRADLKDLGKEHN